MFVSKSHWCLHSSARDPHSLSWGHTDKWVLVACLLAVLRLEMPSHLQDQPQKSSGWVLAHLFLLQISIVSTFFLREKKKQPMLFIDQNAEHNFLHLLKITPITIETAPKQTEITHNFLLSKITLEIGHLKRIPRDTGKIT